MIYVRIEYRQDGNIIASYDPGCANLSTWIDRMIGCGRFRQKEEGSIRLSCDRLTPKEARTLENLARVQEESASVKGYIKLEILGKPETPIEKAAPEPEPAGGMLAEPSLLIGGKPDDLGLFG